MNATTLRRNQERAVRETIVLLVELMRKEGITQAELAKRLGHTEAWIINRFDGTVELTLRDVSDMMTAMGHEFSAQRGGEVSR